MKEKKEIIKEKIARKKYKKYIYRCLVYIIYNITKKYWKKINKAKKAKKAKNQYYYKKIDYSNKKNFIK